MRAWVARMRGVWTGAERRFPVLTELVGRLASGNLLDAGTRLAAQAFLAAVPLLFAVAAFAPHGVRDQLLASLRAIFGLSGPSDQELQRVLDSTAGGTLRDTSGAVGVVLALVSATSFSRAMARVCERAWQLPKSKTRIAAWRWLVWLLALLMVVLLQGPVRDGFGAGGWVGFPLYFLVSAGVWLWTQHLLLAKRVAWLPLLPGALLAAAATTALGLTAPLYVPNALNRALEAYGSLGLVFTLLSWLIVMCAALTFAFTIGAVLAREPTLSRYLGTEAGLASGPEAGPGSGPGAGTGAGPDPGPGPVPVPDPGPGPGPGAPP
ncbi:MULTISPECIES: YhjD/YihY/BrkB family envelope integrity protein [unclassified Streptomyces]|uniref:YhjD/YihY/BrkB family envelope integrity protein n=1 Tax=unclassified Streptomyces TaxID=2593676 RepID=UPI000B0CA2F3|nr:MULTISPECIES: YhjD/YihY/BrkB family envelope integrity protein [unclassified Streptomyces]